MNRMMHLKYCLITQIWSWEAKIVIMIKIITHLINCAAIISTHNIVGRHNIFCWFSWSVMHSVCVVWDIICSLWIFWPYGVVVLIIPKCVCVCVCPVCAFSNQNTIPPYDSRISTAKLLIETEEFEVRFCTSPDTAVIWPPMKVFAVVSALVCAVCMTLCSDGVERSDFTGKDPGRSETQWVGGKWKPWGEHSGEKNQEGRKLWCAMLTNCRHFPLTPEHFVQSFTSFLNSSSFS